MKELLSIIGAISLVGTSTTSLVACDTPQYNKYELKKEKEKHKIDTANQEIKNNLEWIAPQEKPFNNVDDKWYFVIWHGNENADWKIIKFKNNETTIKIDNSNNRQLQKNDLGMGRDLYITNDSGFVKYVTNWTYDNDSYFKAVYCWNNNSEPNTPFIFPKTGQITDWNLKNQNNINKNDEIKVTVKNKDISENYIYQLEANYFNWLSITNELETNNIPSLIPAEIKLSDGEYGKYLTNLIVSNDKIEEYLNYFSQWYRLLYSKAVWASMTKDLVEDSTKIIFDEKLFILNQVELSGIWGYGNYDIKIFTEKEQININNLQLFNKKALCRYKRQIYILLS